MFTLNKKVLHLVNNFKRSLLFLILFLFGFITYAQQYNVAGNAYALGSPGCYMLTNTTAQSGAVWNIYTIDLTQPFDITLSLNFGNRGGHYGASDCGADGISFVLQPLNSGVFGPGGGVGFQGIFPSLGVIMDTYVENTTDPSYQHISISKNGDVLHSTTTAPNPNELVPPSSAVGWPCTATGTYSCITDGLYHLFRFKWTPTLSGVGTINVYFGSATTLPTTPTLTYTGNLVNSIFNNNPNVYWGVSGSTGGCWNNQSVCISTVANYVADTVACYGQPVLFFDNSLSGLPITTYLWNFGDGNTSNLQNPSHIYTTPGTYLVNLQITNSGGFTSTMTHTVLIHPKPNVTVSDTIICEGDSVLLTASGASSYNWSNGEFTSQIWVSPQTPTDYVVTGVNQWWCTDKDTASVSLYPKPNITVNPDTICLGKNATLTAHNGDSYLWLPGNTTLNPNIVSPTVTTTYTVIGTTNLHGCRNSATAEVVISPDPQISFTIDTINGCEPIKVTFTNFTDPPNSTLVWDFGDGQSSSNLNPSHIYAAGNYNVTITATSDHGCISVSNNPNLINIYPQPHVDFTWSPTIGVISNPIINFTDATTPINPNFTYQWNFGDNSAIDASKNPAHMFPDVNIYDVQLIVTSDYGCADTMHHSIQIVNDSLTYPNIITPNGDGFNDFLVIKGLDGIAYPQSKMVIYNRWGTKVYESNNYQNDFDGKGLADGVYYYIFTARGVLKEISHKSSLEILR